MQNRGMLAKAS